MGLESELQKVRREQELALQAAKEAEQRARTQRQQLRQAALSQRQALVARWTEIVAALLDETAQATWGKDSYTLIKPDASRSLTWAAVCVQGKAKLNYQITLQVSEADLDNLTLNPTDPLVQPSGFRVAGLEEFVSPLSEAGLKDALISAFKSGPRSDGLDQYTEAVLAQSPYKKGEYETSDWKLIVFPILSFLAGLGFLGSGDAGGVLFGLGLMVVSGITLAVTQFGKRFKRLSFKEKAAAVVGCIPGAIVGGFAVLAVVAFFLWLASSAGREERVSEIEEGVKRAMR